MHSVQLAFPARPPAPASGRPRTFGTHIYRDRNVVERASNRLKSWRGIASRDDKHARNYRAGVVVASIVLI